MKSSIRNFVGGFFGGIAGILAAYYFSPTALPFGVLAGVVLGWWHTEIIAMVRDAHNRARTTASGLVQVADEVMVKLGTVCGLPLAFVRFLRWIVIKVIVGSVVWFITAPGRFRKWVGEHPMNLATAMSMTFYVVWSLSGILLGYIVGSTYSHSGGGGVTGALLGVILTTGGAAATQIFWGGDDDVLARLGSYYRDWAIVSRYGYAGLFAYLLFAYVRYTVGFAVFAVVAVGGGLTFFFVAFLCAFPLIFILGMFQGLYGLVRSAGHWMCFGTTLVVTGLSWFYFRNMFENDAFVWSIALATGIVSGAATEFISRPILSFYTKTDIGKWLTVDPLERIVQEHGFLETAGEIAFSFFGQNRMARFFRSICFSAPIARPVAIV